MTLDYNGWHYQEKTIKIIDSGKNIFITGPAGSGKSYLIKQLKEHYGSALQLTASTGVSALNIKGPTIHSWSKLKTSKFSPEQVANSFKKDSHTKQMIINCKYLVIDEISMISDQFLDALNRLLKLVKKTEASFGGIRLILVGDFLQLPPVMTDGEKFCLECDSWLEAKIETIYLNTNFRCQTDPEYAKLLVDIRKGENIDTHYKKLQSRFTSNLSDPTEEEAKKLVFLTSTNRVCNDINKSFFDKIDSPLEIIKGVYKGDEESFNNYSSIYSDMEDLRLKIGTKVMVTVNKDISSGVVNGAIGEVVQFQDPGGVYVKFSDKNGTYLIEQHTWEISAEIEEKADKLVGVHRIFSFTQLPLKQAWAITIHKSQSLTLPKVCLDLNGCFMEGQAYTGLSRVARFDDLYLLPFSKNAIKVNKKVVEWYNRLES